MIRPDCATRKARVAHSGRPFPGAPPGFVTSRCEKRGPKGALRERSRFQVSDLRYSACAFRACAGNSVPSPRIVLCSQGLRSAFWACPKSIDGQGHFLAHKLDPKDLEIFPKVGAVEIDLVDFSRQSLKIHAF